MFQLYRVFSAKLFLGTLKQKLFLDNFSEHHLMLLMKMLSVLTVLAATIRHHEN